MDICSEKNVTELKIASKIALIFFNQKICMLGFSIRKKPKNDPIFLETAKNFLKKTCPRFGTFLTPNVNFFSYLLSNLAFNFLNFYQPTLAPEL